MNDEHDETAKKLVGLIHLSNMNWPHTSAALRQVRDAATKSERTRCERIAADEVCGCGSNTARLIRDDDYNGPTYEMIHAVGMRDGAAEEREACAELCEAVEGHQHRSDGTADYCAKRIRARSK